MRSTIVFLCLAVPIPASAALLYDGSLGTSPGSQGWYFIGSPLFSHNATSSLSGNSSQIVDSTTTRSDQAGHFSRLPGFGLGHPGVGTLDRQAGFRLSFDLKILEEGHNPRDDNGDGREDRAGFSFVIVSEDLGALELGFFEDRVWTYESADAGVDAFTQAEGAAFDTTAALTRYDLDILGDDYWLSANGSTLFSGAMRDYTAFSGSPDVYEMESFLVFGDDTSSADSRFEIARVELADSPLAVPLPGTWWLIAVGALVGLGRHHARGECRRPVTDLAPGD